MTPKKTFENFLVFFITVIVFSLWALPAYMIYHSEPLMWGFLYVPIVLLNGVWLAIIWNKYFR